MRNFYYFSYFEVQKCECEKMLGCHRHLINFAEQTTANNHKVNNFLADLNKLHRFVMSFIFFCS